MFIKALFLNQEIFKSKVLFLNEKRYSCQNQVIYGKVIPKIFDPKNCSKYLENIFADIKPNIWKSKKGASVKIDFLCGGVS